MTSVEICNLALMACGMPSIVDFDETNNNARLCRNFYPVLRDRVLRDHHWSFATAFKSLVALDVSSGDPAYEKVCALPPDLIRIIEISDGRRYRRVGNTVLLAELPAILVYTRRIEDPQLFDATFIEALQNLLAAELVLTNSRDPQLTAYFRNEYEKRLALARSIDSQENRFAMQTPRRRSYWRSSGPTGADRPVKWTQGTEGRQDQK